MQSAEHLMRLMPSKLNTPKPHCNSQITHIVMTVSYTTNTDKPWAFFYFYISFKFWKKSLKRQKG